MTRNHLKNSVFLLEISYDKSRLRLRLPSTKVLAKFSTSDFTHFIHDHRSDDLETFANLVRVSIIFRTCLVFRNALHSEPILGGGSLLTLRITHFLVIFRKWTA
jgi:hypothetical protein